MRSSYGRPSWITVGVIIALGVLLPSLAVSTLLFGLNGNPAPAATIQSSGSSSTSTSSTSTMKSSNASMAVVPGPCQTAQKYTGLDAADPLSNISVTFPIFAVPLSGTAELCVHFADTTPAVNATLDLTKQVMIGTYGSEPGPNGTTVHPFIPATGITVTPNGTTLSLGGGSPTMVDVAFTIHANASRGLYYLNVAGIAPDACTAEFRFAVGYTFTSSNESGSYFPMPAGFGSCTPSGGVVSDSIYAIQNITVIPLSCGVLTCDVKEVT